MQRRFEIPPELTAALYWVLALLAGAELLGAIGAGLRLHEKILYELASGGAARDYGAIALNFVLLFAFARPGRRAVAFVIVAGTLADLVLLRTAGRPDWTPWNWVQAAAGGFGLACLCVFGAWIARGDGRRRLQGSALLAASAFMTIYVVAVDSFEVLITLLHPQTYDFVAWLIDGTLGFQPSQVLALITNRLGAADWLAVAYGNLAYGFAILFSLQQRDEARAPANLYSIFVASALIAVLFYQLCPIAGPAYAFRGDFPLAIPAAESLPHLPSVVLAIAPRNGIPSMHLGWALLLWMNACYAGRWARAGFAVLVGLTVLATLGLGEHYLVDLAAGVPMAVALQGLFTHVLPWRLAQRRRAVLWGFAMVLGWIGAVRFGVEVFLAMPGLTWLAMLGTLWASVALHRGLARASRAALAQPDQPRQAPAAMADAAPRRELRTVMLMFVLSGFAALVYQVLFSKALALTFGSQAIATYTVLAVYMGGMALGAWLGGRLAARRADALKLYAYCELGIGLYCAATPWIFQAMQALYVSLASGAPPEATGLTALRVSLGAIALGVPTVLMGMTLPILVRFLQGGAASLGRSVALLYGANTVGAAAGALLAGYLVIPSLGILRTTLVTVLLNLVVAALALRLSKQDIEHAAATTVDARTPVTRQAWRLGALALLVLTVGGAVTLALEVNYMHLLAVVAGNSVYAFSLMLFAFLLGLAAGAEVARRLLAARVELSLCLAWTEFALAAVVLLGVYLWTSLPGYFASFAFYPVADSFGTRELIRGLVCLVAMLPPALAIGTLYPLAMEAVGRAWPDAQIPALGRAAALNTTGNIAGVLLAGFMLLPWLGALRLLQLLALVCLALGVLVVLRGGLARRWLAWVPVAGLAGLLAMQPSSFDYSALASGANVYFAAQPYGRVIDHAESVDGGLTTVAEGESVGGRRVLTLLTNGKFQGSDGGEMAAQVGVAVAPLLHTGARERALVIGYGTGVSSRTLREAGFARLDIVDLSADIVRLADRHFAHINGMVSGQPGVSLHITDGRNFLLLQPQAYDLVSMEISSIWFAGAGSLYNREFYQLVKKRLRPGGVLQQWVQLHHLAPIDLLYVLGSVHAEFSRVWLYYIGGQGIIVATNDPARAPSAANFKLLQDRPSFAPLFQILHATYAELAGTLLLDPAATGRLLSSFRAPPARWVSTDDNLFLEYSTPKGNALDGTQSVKRNLQFLGGVRSP